MDDQPRISYDSAEPSAGENPTATKTPTRRGPVIAIGVFALVVAVLGGSGLVVSRWLSNTSQVAAEAIPADMDGYIGFDAVRLLSGDVQAALDTFVESARVLDFEDDPDPRSIREQIDKALLDGAGYDFSHDIQPWVGRTAAVGFEIPDLSQGFREDGSEVLLVVEIRDTDAADAFIATLEDSLVDSGVETVEVEGVSLRTSIEEGFTFGRHGETFLFGTDGAVRRSIALPPGESLAESPHFVELTGRLPEDRFLTVFLAPDTTDVPEVSGLLGLPAGTSAWANAGGAFSVSLRPGVIAFDGVTQLDPETFDMTGVMYPPDDAFVSVLSGDTLAFAQWGAISDMWRVYEPVLVDAGVDVAEGVAELNAEVGFDVINDLVLLLDGSSGLAVTRGRAGALFDSTGVPLELMFAAGTSQPEQVGDALARVVSYGEQAGGVFDAYGGGVYAVSDGTDEMWIGLGVVDAWLAAGTSPDIVASLASAPVSPLGPTYDSAVAELDEGNQTINLFVDIAGLVDVFADDPAVRTALAPYQAFVVGSALDGDMATVSMVLTFDPSTD